MINSIKIHLYIFSNFLFSIDIWWYYKWEHEISSISWSTIKNKVEDSCDII